jgi:hypothetical protein
MLLGSSIRIRIQGYSMDVTYNKWVEYPVRGCEGTTEAVRRSRDPVRIELSL